MMKICAMPALNELKYSAQDIRNVDVDDLLIVFQGQVSPIFVNDNSDENINYTMNVASRLCKAFPGLKPYFYDVDGDGHLRNAEDVRNGYKPFDALYNFEECPRVLVGVVTDNADANGLDLSFDSETYGVLRSPEMRQLVLSGVADKFANFIINDEVYSVADIKNMVSRRSGRGDELPATLYHGTASNLVPLILTKGLRQVEDNSQYPEIVNRGYVFLASEWNVVVRYANGCVRKARSKGYKDCTSAIIEIDGNSIDKNRIVLDWDAANMYTKDIDAVGYDNIPSPEDNPLFKGGVLKNSSRNADKMGKFGYKGVIMPNAIKAVYINERGKFTRYTPEEYMSRMNENINYPDHDIIIEVEEDDIDVKQFEPQKSLHSKIWVNNKLNSRVRLRLLDIADDFIKTLAIDWVKPEDIVFTGSLANYNWSKYSDIDLHIMVDYKKVFKKTEFVEDYFSAKKEMWSAEHPNLKIYGFPVEVYVEDTNADNPSSGVYSIEKNKWLVDPDDFQDVSINGSVIKRKAADIMTQIDNLIEKLDSEQDEHKAEILGKRIETLFKKLRNMRAEGLDTKGEMSTGNLIWKICRRMGYIEKLWDAINKSYDRINSIR